MFPIIIEFISSLGYDESGDPFLKHSDFKLNKLSQPRKKILTIINRCTTKKDISLDKARQPMLQILWGVVKKQNIDYVKLIWEDLEFQFKSRRKKRAERVLEEQKEGAESGSFYPHYKTKNNHLTFSCSQTQSNKISTKKPNEPQTSLTAIELEQALKLIKKEYKETQVPTTEEEGFGIRLDTEHSDCISFSDTTTNDETETDESDGDDDEAKGFSVNSRNEKKQAPFFPQYSTHKTLSYDDIYRHLYENPAPTFEDVGLLGDVGTPELISYDGSSGKEKPIDESYDPN
ncbi:hypothetical protein Tco_1344489 [Tanacetum coccineum]